MANTTSGSAFRQKMRYTLVGMGLGDIPCYSAGRGFYCTANFTLNKFIVAMTRWAARHPDGVPSMGHIRHWCRESNREAYVTGHGDIINTTPTKKVVIASVPPELTTRMKMALTGGLLHESAHLLYTHQERLDANEMAAIVIPLWSRVKNWGKYTKPLLTWTNLIEDIRIERWLRAEFANTTTQLADLQDLILKMEGKEDGDKWLEQANQLQVAMGAFRDIGLGYNTVLGRTALDLYKTASPEAWDMVTKGSLTPMLKESIAQDKNGLKTLRLALEVICEIADLCGDKEEGQDGGGGGETPETKCPQCGAGAKALTIKALYEVGSSVRVRGKGVMTCSCCGFQQVVDVEEDGQTGQGDSNAPQPPQPRFEGFEGDSEAKPEGNSAGQGSESEDSEESDGDGSSEGSSDNSEESDEEGSESGGSDTSENGEDSDETGNGSEGVGDEDTENGEGSEKGGSDEGDEDTETEGSDDGEGDDTGDDGSEAISDEEGADDGEAGKGDTPDTKSNGAGEGGSDVERDVAQEMLDLLNQNQTGMVDRDDAVGETVKEEDKKAQASLKAGERRYNPMTEELDLVNPIASHNVQRDRRTADRYMKDVNSVSVAIKTRLQRMVRAMEQTHVYHGTPQGRSLSSRRYVATWGEMKTGQVPTRPYFQKSEKMDTSIAASIVVDQSGSMSGIRKETIKGMLALTDALSKVGAAVAVSGFRDGGKYGRDTAAVHGQCDWYSSDFHRNGAVTNDVFMSFGEKFGSVKHRFAHLRADGGTPTADGMQFGLNGLNERPEGHRIMFVITDGVPYGSHKPVIRHQCRLAAEAGIHIIGVGIGQGTSFVSNLFPDSVYCPNLEDLPAALITKLKAVLDPTSRKRGRRMKKTG